MKGFFIKELNTYFVVINKSGSLLIINTFFKFCKIKNYSFEIFNETKKINIDNANNIVLVVRNPIDRFLTCFWRWFTEKHFYNNIPEEDEFFKMQEFINSEFEYFIDNYYEITKETDKHISQQKYSLADLDNIDKFIMDKKMLKNLYKENHIILKLEDLHKFFVTYISNNLSSYDSHETFYKGKKLPFFNNWEQNDITLLACCYFGTRVQLEKNHHHLNKNISYTDKQKEKVSKMFYDEMTTYGYDADELNDYINKHSKII